jgi:predicted Zn finger-like uncharacterized protein
MSLVATCPSCGTVFSMVREQLEASSGQVRCGHCMVVFDATAPINPAATAGVIESAASETTEAIAPRLPQTDLSFVQHAKKQAFWSQKKVVLTLISGALVLIFLLAFQIVRSESERITQALPNLKPLVNMLCRVPSCAPSKRIRIDGWRIESSNFQKEGIGAFRLTVQLKNTAATSLLVPQLELSLLDISDALLVRRTLSLGTKDESFAGGEDHTYSLLISPQPDLAAKISGYRLFLFHP